MDLAEAVLGGKVPFDHAVSLDDLRASLAGVKHQLRIKQARLHQVIKTGLPALKWYDEQSRAVRKAHHLLLIEAESISSFIPLQTDQQVVPKPAELPSREEFRRQVIRERVLKQVADLAAEKDFETTPVTLDGFEWVDKRLSFGTTVSRKVLRLVSLLEGKPYELVVEAINLFLTLGREALKVELEKMPYFAALFYNDSQYLVFWSLPHRKEADDEIGQRWSQLGSALLDMHVQRQRTELLALLSEASGADVEKAAAQALYRIGQIGRLWGPLLDADLFAASMRVFEGIVLHWLWTHLSSRDYISDETIQQAKRLAASLLRAQEPSEDELSPLRRQIRAYVEAMDMSLMQLTNRIRQGYFAETISPHQAYNLVLALFEDSPSRRACLAEIEEDFQ